jgi:hypothetical protein
LPCSASEALIYYLLVSFACLFGFGGARTGITLTTLAALALIGVAAWSNWRKWSEARHLSTPDAGLHAFFSLNALLLCGMSALALCWVAFPAALLPVCAA